MATNVNSTISVTGGDDPGIWGSSLAVGSMDDARSVSNSSPLQIFVRAKEKINDIFKEIEDYVHDTVTYMQSVQQDGNIVKSEDADQVEGYIAKVRAIRNILTRNHMKVAFFGRTSNGKSSVINAMLCEKILPSDYGHTTSCFLQVEGSDSGESYLVIEGSNEKQNVESVGQLAHALCEKTLGESQLVHIYWPKDKFLLLRSDVVFVDSPGIDMSSDFDEWIVRHCLDADVFVFVANAESALTLAEKNFFKKVSTQLSKPYIFMLYNRWDVVSLKSHSPDQVRAQHMEQAVKFLVTELEVCTQQEANQRIFFVSAEEALQARLQEQKGLPTDSKNNQACDALPDGFQNRYSEFQDFERQFEECISKSAVRTKFEQHSQRGQCIVSEIRPIIDSTYEQAQQLKTQKAVAKKKIYDKLNSTKEKLLLRTQKMKNQIEQMVEDVEKTVFKALSEEIIHLSVLVDEFNLPFHPEQPDLNVYKEKLYQHVENELVRKLHARLSTALAMNIENSQQEMTEQISVLLPAEKKQAFLNALPQREQFDILYHLNCDDLFADFHEDLRFIPSRLRWRLQNDNNSGTSMSQIYLPAMGMFKVLGGIYENAVWTDVAKETELKKQFVAHAKGKLQLIVGRISANCSNQVGQELSSTLAQLSDLVNEATNDMDEEIKTLDKEREHLEKAASSAKDLWNQADKITKQLEIFDVFLKQPN